MKMKKKGSIVFTGKNQNNISTERAASGFFFAKRKKKSEKTQITIGTEKNLILSSS